MKIGIDKYMQFDYFCIVQNKQNQNENFRLTNRNSIKNPRMQSMERRSIGN